MLAIHLFRRCLPQYTLYFLISSLNRSSPNDQGVRTVRGFFNGFFIDKPNSFFDRHFRLQHFLSEKNAAFRKAIQLRWNSFITWRFLNISVKKAQKTCQNGAHKEQRGGLEDTESKDADDDEDEKDAAHTSIASGTIRERQWRVLLNPRG